MSAMINSTKLLWEWGTAYDMFISLAVLHQSSEFGVRGSWASSVRRRLRPPTVTHHLQALRLAGLVQVTLGGGGKEKKSYAARSEAVKTTCRTLENFLVQG